MFCEPAAVFGFSSLQSPTFVSVPGVFAAILGTVAFSYVKTTQYFIGPDAC